MSNQMSSVREVRVNIVHEKEKGRDDSRALGALVCGIGSTATILASAFVSIVLGIVAICLARGCIKRGEDDGTAKAGQICGIVGLVFSILLILVVGFFLEPIMAILFLMVMQ